MTEPLFFPKPDPLDRDSLLALTGATAQGATGPVAITGMAPLDRSSRSDIAMMLSRPEPGAPRSRAGAVVVSPANAPFAPEGALALVAADPQAAFARVVAALYPLAARPQPMFGPGVSSGAIVHSEARLEAGVSVDPGAVIGPGAEIGGGALICANAVVGPGVRLGRHSTLGPGASVVNALVGDRVVIRQGARIGQDGLDAGSTRTPQIGRAIVQDDVEIGANAAIDRGSDRDTVIGQGARIDNLVQIGHNVVIGRGCIVLAGVRVDPGRTVGDFVVLGVTAGPGAA